MTNKTMNKVRKPIKPEFTRGYWRQMTKRIIAECLVGHRDGQPDPRVKEVAEAIDRCIEETLNDLIWDGVVEEKPGPRNIRKRVRSWVAEARWDIRNEVLYGGDGDDDNN